MKRVVYSMALLAIAGSSSWAKVAVVFRLASPPMPVEAGQRFSLCAANVGTVNADLTLQFINVRTGAIVASRDVTLPAAGIGRRDPDPCLQTTAEALAAQVVAPADPPLLVALVVIKRSLQPGIRSYSVGAGDGTRCRGRPAPIGLDSAASGDLINGRNTPNRTGAMRSCSTIDLSLDDRFLYVSCFGAGKSDGHADSGERQRSGWSVQTRPRMCESGPFSGERALFP